MSKRVMKAGIAATAALMLYAPTANAADFYMNGLFGVGPKYSTMTGPEGQKCDTRTTCERLPSLWTSGERSIERAVAEHGKSGNTFWVFSKSTVDAINYLNDNPDDQNTWIMSGSPSKPGNGDNRYPLTNTTADVTFMTVEGDSIAQPRTGGSLSTHIRGYNYLDGTKPVSSRTIPGTNTKDNVYSYPDQPFNLFDPRTWGSRNVTVTEEAEVETTRAAATTDTEEAEKPRKSRAERKAEKKAEREERKAAPKAEREERKAERAEKADNEPRESRKPKQDDE